MVIYLITNKVNGKQYVGQTIYSAELRFSQHCKPSETSCRLLNRAIQKYGTDSFELSVLEEVGAAGDLDAREVYWIERLKTMTPNGYNLTAGGNGKKIVSQETRDKLSASLKGKFVGEENPFWGKHHSEETKQKLRASRADMRGEKATNYGRRFSEETCRKISESKRGENHPCYGKHLSEETRRKISEAKKGQRNSDDALRRMAETKRGKKLSPEHCQKLSEVRKGLLVGGKNPMAKKVLCVETGQTFTTIKSAAESIGVYPETLGRHLKGKSPRCGGFHWKYVEEVDK